MENDIKPGDVVKTSEHDYEMTVETIDTGIAVCLYFTKERDNEWGGLISETYSLKDLEFIR